MSKIGLGLAALGRPEYINIRQDICVDKSRLAFRKNALNVLDEAYSNGVRFFDTAPSYGKGELFLLEWLLLNKHTDVNVSTKWGYTYVANWELGYQGNHEIKEHSLEKLREQWEVSKKLLPWLKIYQIHSATLDSGVLTNNKVLNQLFQLKNEYGIQIGLSVSGIHQKEVLKHALSIEIEGDALFDSFQITYNIFEQDSFSIIKELSRLGKFIIIKEALANGRVFELKDTILNNLADKYQVGIDAIALQFCIQSATPDRVLSGASTKGQLRDNLNANEFSLLEDEVNDLKKLKLSSEVYWRERSELSWD
ncbi:aldo/keto reductase [Flavicella sp.]|uniref:aldo/keto reductase n=1 Tax=Flavicella sp. TaxID=2957742 RepID=UPI00301B4FF7